MFITFILLISSFNYIYLSAENYKCKASDVNREIEIGDEVTLCIHSQKKGIKIAYKLKVDEYSIITMESGFDYLAKNESKAQTPVLLRDLSKKNNFRRIKEEFFDEKKKINLEQNNNNGNEDNTINTDNIEANTISNSHIDNTNNEESSDESSDKKIENENYGDKFVAQIGDKITQYPSVIIIFLLYNLYFIYFYSSIFYLMTKRTKKFLLFLV